jgi:Gpi18-like mannosyltransferase
LVAVTRSGVSQSRHLTISREKQAERDGYNTHVSRAEAWSRGGQARWVAVADGLSVAGVVLAIAVAIGGGFRLWIGDFRISVTSPIRLLVFSVVIGLIRHAIVRRPTVLSRAIDAVRRVGKTEAWSAVWPAFVVTRVTVMVVGLLAVHTVGFPPKAPPFRVSTNEAINLPARWDAGWYLGIASTGYRWQPARTTTQQNVAFFPAFPAITHVVGRVFGGSTTAYVAAGVLISCAAFFWSLLYLYQLARRELGSAEKATWAIWLLAAYPFSVFHGAIYTESLFLLGCVGAVVELRNDRPLRAAAWGLLVGLTRPNGFFLAATLAALVGLWLVRTRSSLWSRQALMRACAIGAPVAGVLVYSIYLARLTGNPLQWSAQHAAWGRTFTALAPFVDAADVIASQGFGTYVAGAPYDVLNAAAVIGALLLVVPIWRHFGVPYVVFVCVNLLPPLFRGGVMSMGRLSATLFPLFLCLALKLDSRGALWLIVAFSALQAFLAVLFYTWRPLF